MCEFIISTFLEHGHYVNLIYVLTPKSSPGKKTIVNESNTIVAPNAPINHQQLRNISTTPTNIIHKTRWGFHLLDNPPKSFTFPSHNFVSLSFTVCLSLACIVCAPWQGEIAAKVPGVFPVQVVSPQKRGRGSGIPKWGCRSRSCIAPSPSFMSFLPTPQMVLAPLRCQGPVQSGHPDQNFCVWHLQKADWKSLWESCENEGSDAVEKERVRVQRSRPPNQVCKRYGRRWSN